MIIKKHTYSAKTPRQPHKRKNQKMNVFNSYVLSEGRENNISIMDDEGNNKLLDDSKYSIGGLIEVGRGTEKMLEIYRSDRMMSAKNIRKEVASRVEYENIKHYDNYFPMNNFANVIGKFGEKRRGGAGGKM